MYSVPMQCTYLVEYSLCYQLFALCMQQQTCVHMLPKANLSAVHAHVKSTVSLIELLLALL
jgi:hypothetical protein